MTEVVNRTAIVPQAIHGPPSASPQGAGGGLTDDEVLARVAMRLFANEDMPVAIDSSLIDLGVHADAEAVVLLLFAKDDGMIDRVHAWRRDGQPSQVFALVGENGQNWLCGELDVMKSCQCFHLGDLAPEAQQELLDLGITGTNPLIIMPLEVDDRPAGVLLIQHEADEHGCTPAGRVVLDTFGHLLERAVYYQWKEQALRRSTEELKEKQAQIVQSEKMAGIGQLAAGVAHEINNPVGFVMSNLGTLQGYAAHLKTLLDIGRNLDPETAGLPPELRAQIEGLDQQELAFITEDLDGLLAESLEGCERVRDIVQNLKSFARADDKGLIPADLQESVESTLKIVWNELKYRCEIVKQYGEVPQITCRIGEINQVIMNLLVNAAQAIGEQGTITITTRQEGQNAVLEVQDTGCGIAPEHLARVFDPFFTTKPVGKGTGLGLNICHKIVEQHGGTITVASTVGEGTTFAVHLPLGEGEQGGEDIIG